MLKINILTAIAFIAYASTTVAGGDKPCVDRHAPAGQALQANDADIATVRDSADYFED
ncbi:hypothetical protein [uncultured Roseobacter sp.]|uniref:hypothetical protein n=1 Tax=uncultured Roseobacter sp. TaxID=114847 RepID=UPI002625C44C|nr:hypothetical protein [uncultured Roseobacter sp.]